jgi:hypothetical protein
MRWIFCFIATAPTRGNEFLGAVTSSWAEEFLQHTHLEQKEKCKLDTISIFLFATQNQISKKRVGGEAGNFASTAQKTLLV